MTCNGIKLDYEAADRITLLTLVEALADTKKMMDKYENTPNPSIGQMEDYHYNKRLRDSLEFVINYYGGLP